MNLRYADPRLELAVEAATASHPGPLLGLDASRLAIRRLGGIEQLDQLRFLELGHNPIVSVAELGSLTQLRKLGLADTAMSTLDALSGLTALADLDLYASRVIELGPLAGLPLRSLDLGHCLVPELDVLASLVTLESLTLGNPRLHIPRRAIYSNPAAVPLELGPIQRLHGLRQLRLSAVSLASLTVLAELVGLEELILDRCEFADGLREFPTLPRLELLSMNGCEVADLRAVARLPNLRSLELDEAKVAYIEPLLGCASLERLNLRAAEVGDASAIAKLRALPRLELLRVGNKLVR